MNEYIMYKDLMTHPPKDSIIARRDPARVDKPEFIGQLWINKDEVKIFVCIAFIGDMAKWAPLEIRHGDILRHP